MGHKKGKRKRERELRERVVVDRALGIQRKGCCPYCGDKLSRMNPDDPHYKEVFDALESGKCPSCGSPLKVTDNGMLFCSKHPLCKWSVYIQDLDRSGK